MIIRKLSFDTCIFIKSYNFCLFMPSSLYFPYFLSAVLLVILASDKPPYISPTAPLIFHGSNDTSWGDPIHRLRTATRPSIIFWMLHSQEKASSYWIKIIHCASLSGNTSIFQCFRKQSQNGKIAILTIQSYLLDQFETEFTYRP